MAVINATYDEIEQWIDNGTIQDHVAINDTINISYSTYTMPFEVTGFEPTACQIDGEEVTRSALNLFFYYTTPVTVSYGTSGTVKYSESSLRNYINGTLMGQLDQDFVAHLASTKVQTYSRDGSTDVVYDKLFAPSMAQLGVTNTSYNDASQAAVEGPAFTGYQGASNSKRIKRGIDNTGTAQRYWTRSLEVDDPVSFGFINMTGTPNSNSYNASYRVVVACNFIGSGITPPTSAVDNVLVPHNGIAKIPTKILVPYNGLATSAVKCYASKDGLAKLVYGPGTGGGTLNPVDPENVDLDNLSNIVKAGKASEYLSVGDLLTIPLKDGSDFQRRVIGFSNRTVMLNSSEQTVPAIRFENADLVGEKTQYGDTNVHYSLSTLRSYIITTLQDNETTAFLDCLGAAKVQTWYGEGDIDIVYDKQYAPSWADLGIETGEGSNGLSQQETEGPTPTYYLNATSIKRRKRRPNSTSGGSYWVRSVVFDDTDLNGEISNGDPVAAYSTTYNWAAVNFDFIGKY